MKLIIFITVQFMLTVAGFSQKISVSETKNKKTDYEIKKTKNFYVSHSSNHNIIQGNTPSCNNGQYHYENSYFLAYDLKNDFNIAGDWIVKRVDVAIENATAGTTVGQPLIVKLWVMSNYNHKEIITDSLTLIAADTVTVLDNESGTLKNINFSDDVYTVAEGKTLVVEFLLPDGQENENLMFLGSNNSRISDSTYIKAPYCDISEPVNISQIMFPDVMLIADIYGEYLNPDPIIQSFYIEGQIADTEIKAEPDFTVKIIMPADTSLTALTPQIMIPAGFQINPASGETVDFSQGSVIYTVDNNSVKVSQDWTVSVVNATPDIIGVYLPEINGEPLITGNPDYTVSIPVKEGSNLTELAPEIFVYEGFDVSPPSGTSLDFSSGAVTYTVSHQTLPLSRDWQVSVYETPTTSINSTLQDEIKVHPNPADKFILVNTKNTKKTEIVDLYGKVLKTSNYLALKTSDIPEGVYFIKIYVENNIIVKKIIIKH